MIWYGVIIFLSENTFIKKHFVYFYIDYVIFLGQRHGAENSQLFIEASNPLDESTDLESNTLLRMKT